MKVKVTTPFGVAAVVPYLTAEGKRGFGLYADNIDGVVGPENRLTINGVEYRGSVHAVYRDRPYTKSGPEWGSNTRTSRARASSSKG